MRRNKEVWGLRMRAAFLPCILAACSSSGGTGGDVISSVPTAELVVQVEYSSRLTRTSTQSLHVWALRPKAGAVVSCNELVGGKVDPYDYTLLRLADYVTTDVNGAVTIESVELGDAYVYVEGVNFGGVAEIAGCGTVTLEEPSGSVSVTLSTAGVFDCGAPDTEDGARCDDGEFCTVGETCRNGRCQGGRARNCSALADDCNASECSEAEGCFSTPLMDGSPCNDGLYCTVGDSCQEGLCVGTPRECDGLAEACQQAVACSEELQECVLASANEGEPCDDGLHCTVDSVCFDGSCVGTNRDCSLEVGDDCNAAACSEEEEGCYTTPRSVSTYCEDAPANECTSSWGYCDGAGQCELGHANEGNLCEEGAGTCSSGTCEPNDDGEEEP